MVPTDEVIRLLKQIADHTSHDNSAWVAGISGGSALLGAAIVGAVSYFVGRRTADSQERIETARLHTNVVTAERLRWLQDIRQRTAHLFVQMDMQYNYLKRPVRGDPAPFQEQLDGYSTKIMEGVNVITLMLNPAKPDQAALRSALQGALAFLQECFVQKGPGPQSFDDQRYAALKQGAFDSLISIGTSTWARIKRLE